MELVSSLGSTMLQNARLEVSWAYLLAWAQKLQECSKVSTGVSWLVKCFGGCSGDRFWDSLGSKTFRFACLCGRAGFRFGHSGSNKSILGRFGPNNKHPYVLVKGTLSLLSRLVSFRANLFLETEFGQLVSNIDLCVSRRAHGSSFLRGG